MNDFKKILDGEDIYVLVKEVEHGQKSPIECDVYACRNCNKLNNTETLPFLGTIVGFNFYSKNCNKNKTPYIKVKSINNNHIYNLRYEKDLVNQEYTLTKRGYIALKNGGILSFNNKCFDICIINDITKAKLLFKKDK